MAFFKGSFYETTSTFEPDAEGRSAFRGVRARQLAIPEPVLEHRISTRDRLDSVAHHYYADPRAWRRLVEANPHFLFPEDLLYRPEPVTENGGERTGELILIPRRRDTA